jgi:hypothetical protein
MCLFVSLFPLPLPQASPLTHTDTVSPLGDRSRMGRAVQVHRANYAVCHLARCPGVGCP